MFRKRRLNAYEVAIFWLLLAVFPIGCAGENKAWQPAIGAVQTIYRDGVPHTDRRGRPLLKYDADRSFFPIGSWGAPLPQGACGRRYDWQVLVNASYNTAWPWYKPAADSLQAGADYGMQSVLMGNQEATTLKAIKDHPNLLGNMTLDEPIAKLGTGDMDQMFADFLAYKKLAEEIAPDMPVFVNDAPWIVPPATEWWIRWNSAGDVSCHDNYPIWPVTRSLNFGTSGSVPNGIPQSVALAVKANEQQNPVWLLVGAWDDLDPPTARFPFRYPTPMQLRALVYSGVIHGATGIHYFIWDSYISRGGRVVGMSPDPQVAYVPLPRQKGNPPPSPATPTQLVMARASWDMAAQINKELQQLTPVILAPTVGPEIDYSVMVEGEAITDSPVRALLKPHPKGGYVLLTVNLDNAVLVATYRFDRALSRVEVMFENREDPKVKLDGMRFSEDYEPFETHIYRIVFQGP
jgi:hypothetical protein